MAAAVQEVKDEVGVTTIRNPIGAEVVVIVEDVVVRHVVAEGVAYRVCRVLRSLHNLRLSANGQCIQAAYEAVRPPHWKRLPVVLKELPESHCSDRSVNAALQAVDLVTGFVDPSVFQLAPVFMRPTADVRFMVHVQVRVLVVTVLVVTVRVVGNVEEFASPRRIVGDGFGHAHASTTGAVDGHVHYAMEAGIAFPTDAKASGREPAYRGVGEDLVLVGDGSDAVAVEVFGHRGNAVGVERGTQVHNVLRSRYTVTCERLQSDVHLCVHPQEVERVRDLLKTLYAPLVNDGAWKLTNITHNLLVEWERPAIAFRCI